MENDPYAGIIVITSSLALFAIVLSFLTFFALYRKKLITKEAMLKAAEYEKQRILHRQQIENFALINQTEEREKERIARNLHDGVLPLIGTLGQSLAKNLKDYNTPDFDVNRLKKDVEGIEQIGITLRGISHDLVPPYLLSFGLIAAIQEFIERVDGAFRGKANFENRTKFDKQLPLELADQLHVYRICLELLNNLNKHSNYKYLTFLVEESDNGLLFEIQHDGKGVNSEHIKQMTETSKGLGLKSIQTRVMLLNASIEYVAEDEISSVSLFVPLKQNKSKTPVDLKESNMK